MRLYRLGNVKSPLLVGLAGADVVHCAAAEREGDARDLVDLQRRAEHHAVHGHREDDQPKKDDGARSCVKLQGTFGPAVSEPTILLKYQKFRNRGCVGTDYPFQIPKILIMFRIP